MGMGMEGMVEDMVLHSKDVEDMDVGCKGVGMDRNMGRGRSSSLSMPSQLSLMPSAMKVIWRIFS